MLIKKIIRPVYKYCTSADWRTFQRLLSTYGNMPRGREIRAIDLGKMKVDVADGPSFVWQFKDIFVDQIYKFNATNDAPVIYDCGANVGTGVMYFKKIYPRARVTAIEADSTIAGFLTKNIQQNGLEGVKVLNKAVWVNNDGVSFAADGADGGAISENPAAISVPSIRLQELIAAEPTVDLLKIDIEGAETEVILDCAEVLVHVEHIFIEFHSLNGSPQKLSKILDVLEKQGFRYYLETISRRKTPFVAHPHHLGMDMQLNVFAYRLKN